MSLLLHLRCFPRNQRWSFFIVLGANKNAKCLSEVAVPHKCSKHAIVATALAAIAENEVPKRPHFEEGCAAPEGLEHAPTATAFVATTGSEVSKGPPSLKATRS
jgi:hypothetical protein